MVDVMQLLAFVFLPFSNPPDLSPEGNLPVCNNEKPAESRQIALLCCSILMSRTLSLLQTPIRSQLEKSYLRKELQFEHEIISSSNAIT